MRTDPMQAIAKRLDPGLLTKGSVVIIGAGGVGSCLIPPLTTFLAAVALSLMKKITLTIVDGDYFTAGNAYRVDIPAQGNKAQAWFELLAKKFPAILAGYIPRFITKANQSQVIQENDVVFLCCDNHATRKLVSDRVGQLKNCILISGGNDGVTDDTDGTAGNIQVYGRRGGKTVYGSPLDKFHPEIAKPADKNPEDMDCLEAAAAGDPQLGFANLAVASAMCNALTGVLMLDGGRRMYDEAVFDIRENITTPQYISGPKIQPAKAVTRKSVKRVAQRTAKRAKAK